MKPWTAIAKAAFQQNEYFFQESELKFKQGTSKMLQMVLKFGPFGKQIRSTWEVLKCQAGEGGREPVGPIV
jgi:hypothetical protein